jgi:hypothetical protein
MGNGYFEKVIYFSIDLSLDAMILVNLHQSISGEFYAVSTF